MEHAIDVLDSVELNDSRMLTSALTKFTHDQVSHYQVTCLTVYDIVRIMQFAIQLDLLITT
jgi:hypothetical protein